MDEKELKQYFKWACEPWGKILKTFNLEDFWDVHIFYKKGFFWVAIGFNEWSIRDLFVLRHDEYLFVIDAFERKVFDSEYITPYYPDDNIRKIYFRQCEYRRGGGFKTYTRIFIVESKFPWDKTNKKCFGESEINLCLSLKEKIERYIMKKMFQFHTNIIGDIDYDYGFWFQFTLYFIKDVNFFVYISRFYDDEKGLPLTYAEFLYLLFAFNESKPYSIYKWLFE